MRRLDGDWSEKFGRCAQTEQYLQNFFHSGPALLSTELKYGQRTYVAGGSKMT